MLVDRNIVLSVSLSCWLRSFQAHAGCESNYLYVEDKPASLEALDERSRKCPARQDGAAGTQ